MVSLFDAIRKPSPAEKDSVLSILKSLLHRSPNGIIKIAPGVARRILDETNFEGQRTVKTVRLAAHLRRIRGGSWIPSFPITFALLPDGTLILVDGQHRLSAIAESETVVEIRVIINSVPSLAEARKMYAGFDGKESIRTELEVLDGIGITEAIDLPRRSVGYIFRALTLLNNGLEPARGYGVTETSSLDARIAISTEWMDEARAWHSIVHSSDAFIRRKLWNAGSTAVGLYTLKYQPAKALKFWQGLADNNGLGKYDPRARLIADFQNRGFNSGSARQSVQAPAVAWNAWNEGRELKIIKCIEGAPITIWGTPFSKGNV